MDLISEAGAEQITVIINTLDRGEGPSGAHLADMEQAIRGLHRLGFAALGYEAPGDPPVPAPRSAALLNLCSWLTWEPRGGYWKSDLPQAEPEVTLMVPTTPGAQGPRG